MILRMSSRFQRCNEFQISILVNFYVSSLLIYSEKDWFKFFLYLEYKDFFKLFLVFGNYIYYYSDMMFFKGLIIILRYFKQYQGFI